MAGSGGSLCRGMDWARDSCREGMWLTVSNVQGMHSVTKRSA